MIWLGFCFNVMFNMFVRISFFFVFVLSILIVLLFFVVNILLSLKEFLLIMFLMRLMSFIMLIERLSLVIVIIVVVIVVVLFMLYFIVFMELVGLSDRFFELKVIFFLINVKVGVDVFFFMCFKIISLEFWVELVVMVSNEL